MLWTVLLSIVSLVAVSASPVLDLEPRGQICKVLPGDSAWPAEPYWNVLNNTVEGRLIHYRPPGVVCDSSNIKTYHADKCTALIQVYYKQSFITPDPGTTRAYQYLNHSCDPIAVAAGGNCGQGYYPEYVINVTKAEHITAAVKFARRWGVRLNVKNTGHDFIGRSTARGSLSLWVSNWKGIEWHNAFTPSGGSKTYPAVTLTGGIQWKDVYSEASARNRVIAGGSCSSVGSIGGYLQGGGHGLVSHDYGMAVDNVLEFTVVLLTDGRVVTANAQENSDLFWALRGGGGGTYGIVISATSQTFPSAGQTVIGRLELNVTDPNGDKEPWWQANALMHQSLGALSDKGVMGSYFTLSEKHHMHADVWVLNKTAADLTAATEKLVSELRKIGNQPGSNLGVNYYQIPLPWSSFIKIFTSGKEFNIGLGEPLDGNYDSLSGSRLLPRSAIEKDPNAWLSAFKHAVNGSTAVLGHLVAEGKVKANKNLDIGLNPAWRTALSHMVLIYNISAASTTAERIAGQADLQDKLERFRKLSPGSGSYLNEADIDEPNKNQAFFGSNYFKLSLLKAKYDPYNLLYCGNCVGNEKWRQIDGRLCRAS